jgi:hypothetical protein
VAGAYRVEPPRAVDLGRCGNLQERNRDLALGVVDASVVALAERLGESKVATLDQRHFRAVRPAHVASLELLPYATVVGGGYAVDARSPRIDEAPRVAGPRC